MIEQLRHKQKNVYFDILDDKEIFYPDLLKLVYASQKRFVVSPYFMGGVETSLAEDLDIYVRGYVSYRPFYDFWRFMIDDPSALVRGLDFFVREIGKRNIEFLEFLQLQVMEHFDPLYRATCCYFLNKIIKEGTITCGHLDPTYSRLTSDVVTRIQNFKYNGNFSVDMLDWSIVDAADLNNSALLLLPHQINRGLVDTGNNVIEKNILNFSRLRKYLGKGDNKVILACTTKKSVVSFLESRFDVIKVRESEDSIGIIAHNV
tara:strand:- start:799 stop:1581 length:783 start_codon:yes stop_codon:yes gene_type:complete